MSDNQQSIEQLSAKLKDLELRLQATEEVYSEYIKDLLIKSEIASENTTINVISNEIDEALAKSKKG